MTQQKDTDWLNGYKNKTVYKRDPPQTKGHIQTESEGLEIRYFMQTETKRKQEYQYSYERKYTLK